MRQEELAAVVLSENSRSRYVSGYQRYYIATYLPFVHAVVMTMNAGPVLLLPRQIMQSAEECIAEKAVEFPQSQEGKIETLASVLGELGVQSKRIGMEFDFLHYGFLASLKERLHDAEIADVSSLMTKVTAVKFPEEVELLRQAAHIADKGTDVAIKAAVEGASELEVAALSSDCMLRGGAEFINHMTVRAGPHAVGNYPIPTQRIIQKGDCVMIDLGCVYQGYVSDMNRTIVVGTPTDEQRELIHVGQEMLEQGIAAVQAGVFASEVWRASFEVADRVGMADRIIIPFTGHGVGISLHEEPYIKPDSDIILEEGMVLALEPGVYAAGIGGCRPEDMLVVTATGAEVLTHYPSVYELLQS